jgi:thiosulfate/3-mercaptopyruvate sulfurtransferase
MPAADLQCVFRLDGSPRLPHTYRLGELAVSRTRVLVNADWVEAHLDDPSLVLVEVDEDTSVYDKNHIRGALRIDWRQDLQDPVRRDFVDQAGFEALLSAKGIAREDTVVLYGGNNNWFAAFAYWYFKIYGHQDVRLLDGGRKKWELDGRELVSETVSRPATVYTASAPDDSVRALRDEVLGAIGSRNVVDVRSPEEFSGKLSAPAHLIQEAALQRGHIPTAVNVPWSKAANDDGTFRSDEELGALYAEVDAERDTIVYCRIGERSAHTWFVLSEILGRAGVRNYDGSWAEYGSLVGVPITLPTAE